MKQIIKTVLYIILKYVHNLGSASTLFQYSLYIDLF